MRSATTRPWLTLLLLLAVFSSSPFGSMEQPSAAAGSIAASALVDGASLAPSPGARGLDDDGFPSAPGILPAGPHLSPPAPAVSPTRGSPPTTPPPHLSYDALAPPHA